MCWQCYVQPCMVLFPSEICFSQDCLQLRCQSLSSGGSVSSPPPRVRSRSPRRRSVSPVIRRARSLSRSPVPRREHRASPVANGYSILLLVLNIYEVLLYCDLHSIMTYGLQLPLFVDFYKLMHFLQLFTFYTLSSFSTCT